MKNNKLLKAIAATIVCSTMGITAFSFAACGGNGEGGEGGGEETTHYHTYSSGNDWGYDGANHWRYATCEHTDLIAYKAPHEWEGESCTVCGAVKKLIKPTLTEADDPAPDVDEDGNILVNYEFNASKYPAETCEQDIVSGIYTIKSGTMLRSKTPAKLYTYDETNGKQELKAVDYTTSIRIGSASDIIEIDAPAAGTFVMHVGNGSSNRLNDQLNLITPTGAKTISYYAEGASGPCIVYEMQFEKEGKYRITRIDGTSDIYYMSYSAKVKASSVESITVASAGNANYFVGQDFAIDGLAVNAITETGSISPIPNGRLLIDYTAFNSAKSGTYEIGVSYTKAGHTYETSYNVNVYAYENLTLGTDKIVKEKDNTSAGNGVYANHSLRQLYFTGETLSTDGLSVILNGMINGKAQDFLLKDNEYKVSTVDMSTAGKKEATVSYTTGGTTKSKTIEFYVIEKDAELATATSVNIAVDPATTDANIGVKNGDNAYQFKTIHQALDFLNNSGVSATAAKTINLAAGTYWEKLEVTVPNLTIVGANKDNTIIEYDALYGLKDAGGFEHTTDSTATLNVREAAENFTIKNVTVSNYYNSVEHFDERLGAGYGEHRALALLVQSDKFTMDNCKLLGYQDTVEFFKGRQFIVNSYIAGTTDFIFGTNNTTYFYNCEIHSIDNGKTDGGYITAFKGCNKDAKDAVTYGAIFDKCHFTAATKVVENGNTAIGRPWGAYAAVAVINSEIDGHVSTVTSDLVKNQRYVAMSGVKPTDSTVKFREYNNTGDGAITAEVGGMKMLSSAEAKNYSDFSVIFGTKNGGVSYSAVWMPVRPDAETHSVNVVTKDGVTLGALTIEDGSAILPEQIQALVSSNETYKAYDIVGVYSNAECTTEYTYPEISADGNVYVELHFEKAIVSSTTINFKENANYADLVSSGKLEITPAEEGGNPYYQIKNDCIGFASGAEISLDLKAGTTVIVGTYGQGYTSYTVKTDGVLKTDLTGADAETGELTGDVEFTVDSNCTVTLVCGSSEKLAAANFLKTITVNVPHTYAIGETINLLDYDGSNLEKGATGKWNGIIITTDNGGKFSKRAGDIQCAVGTVLTFNVADGVIKDNITVISYQDGPVAEGTWDITVENGVATVECIGTASNHQYIKSIQIA